MTGHPVHGAGDPPPDPPKVLRVPLHQFFARRFRPRRMRAFCEIFGITESTRVLDVGGTQHNWLLSDVKPQVTVLNIAPPAFAVPSYIRWQLGNALELPFPDGSFDVAFSNSVIEHVGSWENQVRFAQEIRRIAPRYFVQTPNRHFPVEPHFLTPFVQYLPPRARMAVARHFTVWGWFRKPSQDEVRTQAFDIRLLSRREVRLLFPDATLINERFAGLTKSFMAYR